MKESIFNMDCIICIFAVHSLEKNLQINKYFKHSSWQFVLWCTQYFGKSEVKPGRKTGENGCETRGEGQQGTHGRLFSQAGSLSVPVPLSRCIALHFASFARAK